MFTPGNCSERQKIRLSTVKMLHNDTIPVKYQIQCVFQLVNRQKSAKAKQPIPLSEDMLRELDKSHMGGFDDLHQLKEREIPYQPSGKVKIFTRILLNFPAQTWSQIGS